MFISAEELEKSFGQDPGFAGTPRIRQRLTAARLLLGTFNLQTQPPKYPQGRYADVGIELIDVAWYE